MPNCHVSYLGIKDHNTVYRGSIWLAIRGGYPDRCSQ